MSQYVRKLRLDKPNFRGAKDTEHLAEMMGEHLRKVSESIEREFTNVERAQGISGRATNVAISGLSSDGSGGGSSISITDYIRTGSVAITSAGTPVLFSSDMGIVPSIFQFRCYNSAGDTIGCMITSLSSTGFTATSLEDATLEYYASKVI